MASQVLWLRGTCKILFPNNSDREFSTCQSNDTFSFWVDKKNLFHLFIPNNAEQLDKKLNEHRDWPFQENDKKNHYPNFPSNNIKSGYKY